MQTAIAYRAAWLRSVILGFLAWIIGLFAIQPDWCATLLLFGALVVVPLGLALIDDLSRWGIALACSPSCRGSISSALSRCSPLSRSTPASAPGHLALPWLGFTTLVALLGFIRLVRDGYRTAAGIATSAAMIFLAIGGGWTLASRWGMEPMGFREPIVLLTGAHFHFAGFALPILTGLAAGTLRNTRARLAVAGVVVGVPFVAVGITVGKSIPVVELSAAWFLAITCLLVVGLQWELAVRTTGWPECLLFALSGLALLAGMSLAAVYALSTFQGAYWLTIPQMIPWHGTLNALGFALPGLLAWHIARMRGTELQMVLSVLGEVPCLDEWEKRRFGRESRMARPREPAGTNTSARSTSKRRGAGAGRPASPCGHGDHEVQHLSAAFRPASAAA